MGCVIVLIQPILQNDMIVTPKYLATNEMCLHLLENGTYLLYGYDDKENTFRPAVIKEYIVDWIPVPEEPVPEETITSNEPSSTGI